MSAVPAVPRFEFDGLLLTLPSPAAAGRMATYMVRNLDRFAPSMPAPGPGFPSEAYHSGLIDRWTAEWEQGTSARLVLFEGGEEGRVVGHVSYTAISRGPLQACYLGYMLERDHEGKGVMYEALRRSNEWVFDTLGLHRIMANYLPANERSGRLLRRLGFQVEGYARDYLLLGGDWKDHILTALLNPRHGG
ncbi:MAG TPA: GNAT family N-acetyltransferase [Vulgatibacter sp.]